MAHQQMLPLLSVFEYQWSRSRRKNGEKNIMLHFDRQSIMLKWWDTWAAIMIRGHFSCFYFSISWWFLKEDKPQPRQIFSLRTDRKGTGLTALQFIPVLRCRQIFGRLRLRESEFPELSPTKLGRLRLQAKKGGFSSMSPYTNIFHFELLKRELLMEVFFGSLIPL